MDKLNEMMYYILNKPYFEVYVISNGRKVKRFVQLASSKVKGEDFFLISKDLKCAWWKPDTPIIDGLKFKTFVDLNNAVPLRIDEEYNYIDSLFLIKEEKKVTISEDTEKQKKNPKNGKPVKFVEISFPPTLLYQKMEAHFIKLIMSSPPSKWEELKWVFIVGFIVLGIIVWNLTSKGITGFGG